MYIAQSSIFQIIMAYLAAHNDRWETELLKVKNFIYLHIISMEILFFSFWHYNKNVGILSGGNKCLGDPVL